jgi:hypothetical protein
MGVVKSQGPSTENDPSSTAHPEGEQVKMMFPEESNTVQQAAEVEAVGQVVVATAPEMLSTQYC